MSNALPLFLALALATLPLAGCLGSEEPATLAPAEDEGGDAADAAADAGTPAVAPEDANATASPAPAREIPVALEGSVPTFAAACAFTPVVGQCVETPGQWNSEVVVEASGTGESLVLTLTWEAASPLTEELYVYFVSHSEDWSESVHHAFAAGSSPLTLELAEPVELPEGMTHEIGVGVPFHGTPGGLPAFAGGTAAMEQAFSLKGVLVLSG